MTGAALITGGTEGIGRATALALARRGEVSRIIVAGRNLDKGKLAAAEIQQAGGRDIDVSFFSVDLSLLSEARRLAEYVQTEAKNLRFLVHSAGAMPGQRRITAEGEDASFSINYLSRFVLTSLLMPQLKTAAPAHVLIVGGAAVNGKIAFDDTTLEGRWSMFRAMQQFQKANQVYALEASRRLQGSGVTINVMAPGMVSTAIRRESAIFRVVDVILRPLMRTPERAAEDVLALLLDPRFTDYSGRTFTGIKLDKLAADMLDPKTGDALWTLSEQAAIRAGALT